MLRALFNEPRRIDDGPLLAVNESIQYYLQTLSQRRGTDDYKFSFWAKGFLDSLNELEQSIYCSRKYAEQVRGTVEERMKPEQLEKYHLFLYFYKNAFIRIFSILDKLGYFLNEQFNVQTERVKQRFSYYTVLREMHERRIHPDLEQQLFDLKVKHKEPMHRLRQKRNVEIHYMNVEFIDDLVKSAKRGQALNQLDNLEQEMVDLDCAYEMVTGSLQTVFQYVRRMLT